MPVDRDGDSVMPSVISRAVAKFRRQEELAKANLQALDNIQRILSEKLDLLAAISDRSTLLRQEHAARATVQALENIQRLLTDRLDGMTAAVAGLSLSASAPAAEAERWRGPHCPLTDFDTTGEDGAPFAVDSLLSAGVSPGNFAALDLAAADVTPGLFRDAILNHGALLMRQAVPAAALRPLTAEIDALIAHYDAIPPEVMHEESIPEQGRNAS